MYADIILESFSLNPFNELDDLTNVIHESTIAKFNDYIMELANTGVEKKNILQRLIDVIVKSARWILNQLKRMWQFIKRLFGKNKRCKSVDQICLEVLGEDKGEASDEDVNIKMEYDPNSENKPPESLSVPVKSLIAEFNADRDSIAFRITAIKLRSLMSKGRIMGGKVPGHEGAPMMNLSYTNSVLVLIQNPQYLDELDSIISDVMNTRVMNNDIKIRMEKWKEAHWGDELSNIKDDIKEREVTIGQLSDFINKFDEIQKKFEEFGDPNLNMEYKNGSVVGQSGTVHQSYEFVWALNSLSDILLVIQFCVTAMSDCIRNAYIIDKSRIGTVSTREQLSAIVYSMIKAGIPGKYISYNAYLLCTPELKGNKGDKNQPIWGQTRVVFYPKNDPQNVLKIAYNGLGISSNRSEYDLYKTISVDSNDASLLARTEWISDNGVLNTMEITDTERDIDRTDLDLLKAKLGRVGKKYSQDLCRDIHSGNVGYIGDRLVCIDYGLVNRKLKGYY